MFALFKNSVSLAEGNEILVKCLVFHLMTSLIVKIWNTYEKSENREDLMTVLRV